jgi:hypothetical protein
LDFCSRLSEDNVSIGPVAMPPTPAAALPAHQWANFGINLSLLVVGLLIGACVVYFCRKLIRRYSWQGYPHLLVAIDAVCSCLLSAVELSWDFSPCPPHQHPSISHCHDCNSPIVS